MVLLAHEVWEDPDRPSVEFGLPHPKKDAFRAECEPNSRLQHVIFAASYNEAMRAYYDWQEWGEYMPADRSGDIVYTPADLEEQRRLRPEHYR